MSRLVLALKAIREEKGVSQEALAKAVGRRQATISRLESGRTRQLDLDLLTAIARVLDVNPVELFAVEEGKRRR